MWLFSGKTKLGNSDLFNGWTDWHCHLLPGVDDGVAELDNTLEILDLYESKGIKKVWLTPHIMEDIPNTTDGLRERYAELKEAYKGNVEIALAAENMIDELFNKRMAASDMLPIGEAAGEILVETSYFSSPINLYGILEDIKKAGYFPVLAHPERYRYMSDDDYDRLIGMDVRLQLNLPSLVGIYGDHACQVAEHLLKKGYYDRMGTDLHRMGVMHKLLDSKLPTKTIDQLMELKEKHS